MSRGAWALAPEEAKRCDVLFLTLSEPALISQTLQQLGGLSALDARFISLADHR